MAARRVMGKDDDTGDDTDGGARYPEESRRAPPPDLSAWFDMVARIVARLCRGSTAPKEL